MTLLLCVRSAVLHAGICKRFHQLLLIIATLPSHLLDSVELIAPFLLLETIYAVGFPADELPSNFTQVPEQSAPPA